MQQKNTKHSTISKIANSSAIKSVDWPVANVLAMQTTRVNPFDNPHAPTGTSPYHSFNLGLHVNDNVEHVMQNRQSLIQFVAKEGFSPQLKMQWLEQVHGNNVIDVCAVDDKAIIADASITREKNIALAIMTADCLPVLLASKQGDEIAAIHGGWRPLAANIIAKTIDKMHTEAKDIVAWLGPCIGHSAFEVGKEVKDAFVKQSKIFGQAFNEQSDGKFFADLHKIAQLQLYALGIKNIHSLAECTYSESNKYYSYRKQNVTGRMTTVICRK